jgi:hypothetical protein
VKGVITYFCLSFLFYTPSSRPSKAIYSCLFLPIVKSSFVNPYLPADVLHFAIGLMLLEARNDLTFCKLGFLYD